MSIRRGPIRSTPAVQRPGSTDLRLVGNIAHPFNFGQISGTMSVSGPDLADLYYLTGLTFPNSPPYSLSAGFGRDEAIYAFRRLNGRLGESDLSTVSSPIDNTSGRPFLTGDLASRRLRFADLTALFGGAPEERARARSCRRSRRSSPPS